MKISQIVEQDIPNFISETIKSLFRDPTEKENAINLIYDEDFIGTMKNVLLKEAIPTMNEYLKKKGLDKPEITILANDLLLSCFMDRYKELMKIDMCIKKLLNKEYSNTLEEGIIMFPIVNFIVQNDCTEENNCFKCKYAIGCTVKDCYDKLEDTEHIDAMIEMAKQQLDEDDDKESIEDFHSAFLS